ncbi:hypothetical protein KIW84_073518 [Lathyrus oleraceus]|uniref:Uncharacterized protein n=1 Tax=Pisum sativum TaxID=3888 RepID=A0A9D4ZWS5_PEA|nr:hypothetical protein KIW84_073518 [Pisum sativum]
MPPRVASVAQRITNADVYSVYYVHRSKGPDAFPGIYDLNRIAWEQCNCLVHSWIINYITTPIAQTIVFLENSIDV